MNATGLFFLTNRPFLVNVDSPTDGPCKDWAFPLYERTSRRGVQRVDAYWRGTDAARFVEQHAAALKRGQALTMTFSGVRSIGDRLVTKVASCELAPDRWPERSPAKITAIHSTTTTPA